jgi:hypothetical protein
MARGKKHTAEQVVNLLRQIEVTDTSTIATLRQRKQGVIGSRNSRISESIGREDRGVTKVFFRPYAVSSISLAVRREGCCLRQRTHALGRSLTTQDYARNLRFIHVGCQKSQRSS